MRLRFILSETMTGLRRNLAMFFSIVLITFATVVLVGGSWLAHKQVEDSKDYWYNKVEVSIFLCGNTSQVASCSGGAVTQAQKDQIQAQLESLKPLVQKVYYESQQQAFERFKEQFKGTAIVTGVTADQMPESFRVKLSDPKKYDVIASSFQGAPGVDQVQDQRQLLNPLFTVIHWATFFSLVGAAVMIVLYLLINITMIRLTAFSRRRETGIMRLVGAPNFVIQLPFILETAIATLIGGVLAEVAWWLIVRYLVQGRLAKATQVTNWIHEAAVYSTAPWLLVGAVLISAVVSGVTLRFYLRV